MNAPAKNFVPPLAETKNPGGDTPGPINWLDQKGDNAMWHIVVRRV